MVDVEACQGSGVLGTYPEEKILPLKNSILVQTCFSGGVYPPGYNENDYARVALPHTKTIWTTF